MNETVRRKKEVFERCVFYLYLSCTSVEVYVNGHSKVQMNAKVENFEESGYLGFVMIEEDIVMFEGPLNIIKDNCIVSWLMATLPRCT